MISTCQSLSNCWITWKGEWDNLHDLRLNSKLCMTQMSTDKSPIPTLSHLKLNQTPLGEHTQAMRVSVWVTLM